MLEAMRGSLRELNAQIPPFLRRTSFVQAAIDEAQTAEEDGRKRFFSEYAEECAATSAAQAPLTVATTKARADVVKAEAALIAANGRLNIAAAAASRNRQRPERLLTRHMRMLRETAPACIGVFEEKMRLELGRVRSTAVLQETRSATGIRVLVGGTKNVQHYSNLAGVQAVSAAVLAALRASQEMSLRVATEAEALEEIRTLEANIPYAQLNKMALVEGPSDSGNENEAA